MDKGKDRRRRIMGIFLVLFFCVFTIIGGILSPIALSLAATNSWAEIVFPPSSTIPTNTAINQLQAKTQTPAETRTLDLLIFGTDRRPGESGNGRSDIIMVVSVNPETGQIKLASILRDTWVSIPGHGWDRINAAYSYGGIELATQTVNEVFGLTIQNYVVLEFDDLEAIIDRIGGVDVPLTKQEIRFINRDDPNVQIPVEEGTYHINGTQALVHCRNRWTGEGDFERTQRQRDVLFAILEATKVQMDESNPISLLLYLMKQVDTNLKAKEVLPLGADLLKKPDITFLEESVPFEGTWIHEQKGDRSVLVVDIQENEKQLHEFLTAD